MSVDKMTIPEESDKSNLRKLLDTSGFCIVQGWGADASLRKHLREHFESLFFDNPTGDDDVRWDNVNNETAAGTAARKRMKHLAPACARSTPKRWGLIVFETPAESAKKRASISELIIRTRKGITACARCTPKRWGLIVFETPAVVAKW